MQKVCKTVKCNKNKLNEYNMLGDLYGYVSGNINVYICYIRNDDSCDMHIWKTNLQLFVKRIYGKKWCVRKRKQQKQGYIIFDTSAILWYNMCIEFI